MTGNTTARTQAIELAERLREVAAWNVRLHLAKEGLEQQTLCEAAGVTKATISARMNLDAAWDLNAIAAAAVTLGMPPAELLETRCTTSSTTTTRTQTKAKVHRWWQR